MELNVQHPNIDIMKDVTEADLACGEECITLCVNNPQLAVALSTPTLNLEGQGSSNNGGTVITENDHTKLINRDANDQHPIDSITGLRDALNNIKVPENVVTEEEFNVVKQEVEYALEQKADASDLQNVEKQLSQKADKADIPTDYVSEQEFNGIKQEVEYALEQKADKSDIPDISNLATKNELQSKTNVTDFQNAVNDVLDLLDGKQEKGDYALKSDLENVSVNVSEQDNLYKDEDILKVFTEAGNSAITAKFARLLDVAQKSDWKSLYTDTGVLILYSGSVSYRTTNGVDFQQVYLPASANDMAKDYELQTIYATVSSSAGMWMYSKDDGLTWTYVTEPSLRSLAWNKVCVKNNGSKKTGWNSSMCFVRTNGTTTQNFAYFSASTNRFELNNNSKKRIDYVTGLNYDYWCANVNGEVFKTAGSSTFTIYENTKAGLNCIKTCNDNIYCGFQDGSIAEFVGYQKPWNFHTVASGEKVTDIQYKDGVYYVVTDNSNFYTSTDLTNWTKTAVINSYGGKLEFTRFGVVQVTEKPVLLPSRQRLEDLLLYLFDRTDFSKICGSGLKWQDGQIRVDIVPDIPIRESQGRINLFNIAKTYFSEDVVMALISAMAVIDYVPADDYDGWLWGDMETGYWDSETWKNRCALWICTGDGFIYDPIAYSWDMEVAQFDIIRVIYDEWGSGTQAEKIGSLAPLKDLFNS